MKKFFIYLAVAAVLFSSCTNDVNDTLEIIVENKSDFDLYNVKYLDISIPVLEKGSAKILTDGKEGTAAISFDFQPKDENTTMSCKTVDNFSVAEIHRKIIITNDTSAMDISTASNIGKLSVLTFVKTPQIQILSGTSPIPPYTGTVEFPAAYVTKTSQKVITIKNTGAANLLLSGTPFVTISGENAGYFTVIQQPSSGTITPGQSSEFTVRFAPTTTNNVKALISIPNNSESNASLDFTISAQGVTGYGELEVKNADGTIPNSTGALDFGTVASGINKQLNVTLKNTGNIDLHFTGDEPVTVSGEASFTVVAQPAKSTLLPGDETLATIKFSPTNTNPAEATLLISSDCHTNPNYWFYLSGNPPKFKDIIYSAWTPQADGGRKSPTTNIGTTTKTRVSFTSTAPYVTLTIHLQVSTANTYTSSSSKNWAYVGKLDTDLDRYYSSTQFGSINGSTSSDFTMTIPTAGTHYIEIMFYQNGNWSPAANDYAQFTLEY